MIMVMKETKIIKENCYKTRKLVYRSSEQSKSQFLVTTGKIVLNRVGHQGSGDSQTRDMHPVYTVLIVIVIVCVLFQKITGTTSFR